jgi:hypothetical protein
MLLTLPRSRLTRKVSGTASVEGTALDTVLEENEEMKAGSAMKSRKYALNRNAVLSTYLLGM